MTRGHARLLWQGAKTHACMYCMRAQVGQIWRRYEDAARPRRGWFARAPSAEARQKVQLLRTSLVLSPGSACWQV